MCCTYGICVCVCECSIHMHMYGVCQCVYVFMYVFSFFIYYYYYFFPQKYPFISYKQSLQECCTLPWVSIRKYRIHPYYIHVRSNNHPWQNPLMTHWWPSRYPSILCATTHSPSHTIFFGDHCTCSWHAPTFHVQTWLLLITTLTRHLLIIT